MEEYLKRFRPVKADSALRRKILDGAEGKRELTLADRILKSARFWIASAAVVLLYLGMRSMAEVWSHLPGAVSENFAELPREILEQRWKDTVMAYREKIFERFP